MNWNYPSGVSAILNSNKSLFLISHFIPRSSATNLGCWAVAFGHTPPSSSPLWRGQRARGHSMAAGTPRGYLQYTMENTTQSLLSHSSSLDWFIHIGFRLWFYLLHCSDAQSPSTPGPARKYRHTWRNQSVSCWWFRPGLLEPYTLGRTQRAAMSKRIMIIKRVKIIDFLKNAFEVWKRGLLMCFS